MSALTIAFLVLAVLGTIGAIPAGQAAWRKFVRRKPSAEEMLEEIQRNLAAPPPGSSPIDIHTLAAEANRRTGRLLEEALELQRQHKEREAIECLLEAYRRDLPPLAKAQLHLLAGNGFFRLSELEEAEGHYRQALAYAKESNYEPSQAAALGNLGSINFERGRLDEAQKYYSEVLSIERKLGDKRGEAAVLGNLGILCKEPWRASRSRAAL